MLIPMADSWFVEQQSRSPISTEEDHVTKARSGWAIAIVMVLASALGNSAISAQEKYAVKVPGGLAFSEFKGYEDWRLVSTSQDGPLMAAILANPVMVDAYRAGAPGNGKAFPDGSRMAKIHWVPTKMETFPAATVPGALHDVDFMVKDSKRFADTGGWGWAVFEYEAKAGNFRPGTTSDSPPQPNDAKCGFACHTIVKNRDFVFTDYGSR
jgi:Cytochrome P460